jgi:hypothetical protein
MATINFKMEKLERQYKQDRAELKAKMNKNHEELREEIT